MGEWSHYETHISTIGGSSQANPWVFGPHENPQRQGSDSRPPCQGPKAPVGIVFTRNVFGHSAGALGAAGGLVNMVGRLFRLRQPGQFKSGLAVRPLAREGPFVVHVVSGTGPARLGMVIPKRWVKRAVHRNQIKRWTRELFKQMMPNQATDVILRVRMPLGVRGWSISERRALRGQLERVMRHVAGGRA